jgi:hypothetical protein
MCFVWISEQTAIISLYNINWLVFRRVRKIAKKDLASSCLSVRPSVRMEKLSFHWKDFYEVWYFCIFRKHSEKIQVSLKSDKNNEKWEMFQTKFVEKIKTHILCSITFFLKSCRLWVNVEKYGTARQATDDNIIRRMRFACRITKATDTHSEYVILITFPRQQWLRERT